MPDCPPVQIMNMVRRFYDFGKKSGNKVYSTSNAEFIADDDWEAHRQQWSVRMMAGSFFRNRNRNAFYRSNIGPKDVQSANQF